MLVLWDVAYTCLHYMHMHKHTPVHKTKVWSTGKRWQLPYDKRIFGCFAKCAYPRRIQHSILDCNAWQAANASSYMQKRAKLFEYEIHIPRPRRLVVPKASKIQFLHVDAWPRSLRERSWRMQKVVPKCPQNPLLHFRNNDNNDIVSHVSLKPTPLTDQLAREPVPAGRIPWVSSQPAQHVRTLAQASPEWHRKGRRPIDKEQEESQQSGKNMQKPGPVFSLSLMWSAGQQSHWLIFTRAQLTFSTNLSSHGLGMQVWTVSFTAQPDSCRYSGIAATST